MSRPGAGGPTPSYSAPAPIASRHQLEAFDCGKPSMDAWLRAHALANEGKASRTYVVCAGATDLVAGYYALAAGGIGRADLPRKLRQGIPDPVPVMVLGRLAVDRRHAGAGLGAAMLRDAMQRTLLVSRTAGVRALILHALDDEAAAFYARYGFLPFPAATRTMFLPVETLESAL